MMRYKQEENQQPPPKLQFTVTYAQNPPLQLKMDLSQLPEWAIAQQLKILINKLKEIQQKTGLSMRTHFYDNKKMQLNIYKIIRYNQFGYNLLLFHKQGIVKVKIRFQDYKMKENQFQTKFLKRYIILRKSLLLPKLNIHWIIALNILAQRGKDDYFNLNFSKFASESLKILRERQQFIGKSRRFFVTFTYKPPRNKSKIQNSPNKSLNKKGYGRMKSRSISQKFNRNQKSNFKFNSKMNKSVSISVNGREQHGKRTYWKLLKQNQKL